MFFWNTGNPLPRNYTPEDNSHHYHRRENPKSCIGLCKDVCRSELHWNACCSCLCYTLSTGAGEVAARARRSARITLKVNAANLFMVQSLFGNTASVASVILNLIILFWFQYGHNDMLDGTRSLLFYYILILLKVWNLRFTQRWLWKLLSSGILCHVVW